MAPPVELLLILAALYLSECFLWVGSGGAIVQSFFLRFGWVSPLEVLRNPKKGLCFLSVLPFDVVYRCSGFPYSVSPSGLVLHRPDSIEPPPDGAPEKHFELPSGGGRIGDSSPVPSLSLDLPSETASTSWENFFRVLAGAPRSQRENLIKKRVRQCLSDRRVHRRVQWFLRTSKGLRILTSLLFALLFGAVPAVYFSGLFPRLWVGLLALYLLLVSSILVRFTRLHRRIWPERVRDRRIKSVLISLAPSYSMRTASLLSQDLVSDSHPLALARALLPRAEFVAEAQRVFRKAVYFPPSQARGGDRNPQEVLDFFRSRVLSEIECRLEAWSLSTEEVLATPEARLSAQAYCPRCTTQYDVVEATCEDCHGIEVVPF